MLTPQQLQETRFEKALFNGYDMGSVDDFFASVAEDYNNLYKENTLLKGKLRILVEKLEDYRRQEGAVQTALMTAQKTCDQMVAEAEKKCEAMLHQAEETVQAQSQSLDVLIGTEEERLASARKAAEQFISGMEKRLARQIELLAELRRVELPETAKKEPTAEEPSGASVLEGDIDPINEDTVGNPEDVTEGAAVAPVEKPANRPLHGELDPAKQRILEELQFGRIVEPEKQEE